MKIVLFLITLLMAVVDPMVEVFRAAMRATAVGAPPTGRLVKFAEHQFVKRGYGKVYAGSGGIRAFLAQLSRPVLTATVIVLLASASSAFGNDPGASLMLAGLAGQTADISSLKTLIEDQGKAMAQFREKHDQELAELKASGTATAETAQAVERANAAVQDIQNAIRDLETRMNRPGNESDLDKKKAAALKAGFFNLMRNKPVDADIRAALVEDATGELLVPEDIEAGIRRVRANANIMRKLADIRTTTSNRVRRRNLTELAVGWGKLETGAALVETTPTPTEAFVYVEDLYGLIRIGEDELADTDVNLEQYVNDSFGRAVGRKEETGYVLGTGHANSQPEGFTLGATVTRVTAGQAAAITADDLLNLIFAVPASYANSPDVALLVARTTELAMRKFKDANGQYLWQPSVQAGSPATFNGVRVYNSADLAAIPAATVTADVAAFGDWKTGYQIVDRLGVLVKRLNELYATSGMVGFLAHARTTGYVSEADALRILRVPA